MSTFSFLSSQSESSESGLRAATSLGRTRTAVLVEQYFEAIRADFQAVLRGELDDVHPINVYAERLHVHPTHLSNTIKAATGQSPCDLINAFYLEEAQRLLRETDLTVAQISDRLGFGEPTNFTKYFKKHLGRSPKVFRVGESG